MFAILRFISYSYSININMRKCLSEALNLQTLALRFLHPVGLGLYVLVYNSASGPSLQCY